MGLCGPNFEFFKTKKSVMSWANDNYLQRKLLGKKTLAHVK